MKPTSAERDEQFKARLKSSGERVTSPRLAIFRALRGHSPVPMGKLTAEARIHGVDRVTVYRTVALLKRLRLVQEVGVGSHRLLELTDDFDGHHHHFWCVGCGKILDFDDALLEAAMQTAADNLGIKIESHQLEITGRCRDCQTSVAPASPAPVAQTPDHS